MPLTLTSTLSLASPAPLTAPNNLRYGLAAGGTAGVRKAVGILKSELVRTMFLMGVGSVEELQRRGPELVRRRR